MDLKVLVTGVHQKNRSIPTTTVSTPFAVTLRRRLAAADVTSQPGIVC